MGTMLTIEPGRQMIGFCKTPVYSHFLAASAALQLISGVTDLEAALLPIVGPGRTIGTIDGLGVDVGTAEHGNVYRDKHVCYLSW